jgi:Tetratricopeptide repeat
MRQLFLRSALTCTLIAGLSQSAIAQDQSVLRSALKLGQQATQLYEQGEYQQALPLAEEALSLREQELGASHPLVAATLSNVATLHHHGANFWN